MSVDYTGAFGCRHCAS